MKKRKLTIKGMHCASCGANIESALKKVEGVKSVKVSVMTHKGVVEVDDSVKDEDLIKAVSRVGYEVAKVE